MSYWRNSVALSGLPSNATRRRQVSRTCALSLPFFFDRVTSQRVCVSSVSVDKCRQDLVEPRSKLGSTTLHAHSAPSTQSRMVWTQTDTGSPPSIDRPIQLRSDTAMSHDPEPRGGPSTFPILFPWFLVDIGGGVTPGHAAILFKVYASGARHAS